MTDTPNNPLNRRQDDTGELRIGIPELYAQITEHSRRMEKKLDRMEKAFRERSHGIESRIVAIENVLNVHDRVVTRLEKLAEAQDNRITKNSNSIREATGAASLIKWIGFGALLVLLLWIGQMVGLVQVN